MSCSVVCRSSLIVWAVLGLPPLGCSRTQRGQSQVVSNTPEVQGAVAQVVPKRFSQPATVSHTIYLGKSPEWAGRLTGSLHNGLLSQELVRQALLVAGRDELGWDTRDAWLGDPMPNQGENAPLEVLPGSGGGAQVEILRGFAPSPVVIGRAKLALSKDRGYSQLLADAEQLSRGSFVTVLKQAGFPGSAHARKPDVAVPEDIEKLLTEMSFCSQFRAVRRLHELTGTQGESPALLGALVRGYANLGMLTEFHWHPAHQVFKSRALLYAQRMTATADDRISGQWHKAYALAAAGLPALALEELAAADKKPDPPEKKPVPKKPAWVDMIAAYCHYDVEKLKPAKTTPSLASGVAWLLGQNGAAASHPRKPESSFASLAWLLGYRALEQSDSPEMAIEWGLAGLKVMPECYRLHDGVCRFAGVALLHRCTLAGLLYAGQDLYARVRAMPGLPEEVRRVIQTRQPTGGSSGGLSGSQEVQPAEEFKIRARFAAALLKTGESAFAEHASEDGAGETPSQVPPGGTTAPAIRASFPGRRSDSSSRNSRLPRSDDGPTLSVISWAPRRTSSSDWPNRWSPTIPTERSSKRLRGSRLHSSGRASSWRGSTRKGSSSMRRHSGTHWARRTPRSVTNGGLWRRRTRRTTTAIWDSF